MCLLLLLRESLVSIKAASLICISVSIRCSRPSSVSAHARSWISAHARAQHEGISLGWFPALIHSIGIVGFFVFCFFRYEREGFSFNDGKESGGRLPETRQQPLQTGFLFCVTARNEKHVQYFPKCPSLPAFHVLSLLLAFVVRSLCSVLLGRVWILGHHVLELRPQALDLAELISNLSCTSQICVCLA